MFSVLSELVWLVGLKYYEMLLLRISLRDSVQHSFSILKSLLNVDNIKLNHVEDKTEH